MLMHLEEKAIELLTHPEKYPGLRQLNLSSIKLRIWQYPAFDVYSSWTLYEENGYFGIRRIQWDRLTKALQTYPIIYGSDRLLPAETVTSLLDKLTAIKLPPFLKVPAFGLDGTFYGIKFGSLYSSAQFCWWSYLPEDWFSLAEWFREAVNSFEFYLPASTSVYY